jgi:hypothetical protein
MHRSLYLAGFGYLAVCAALVVRYRTAGSSAPLAPLFAGPGNRWFVDIKPNCNAVEVEIAQRTHPAPATLEGAGYSAACYALGGKLDLARAVIDQLPGKDRYKAAGIVFDVAHPVADAGDNRSAGPIMELVIHYWPNHYMALYHAGMAEYAMGQRVLARDHLTAFLSYYHFNDGWTRSARDALARLR